MNYQSQKGRSASTALTPLEEVPLELGAFSFEMSRFKHTSRKTGTLQVPPTFSKMKPPSAGQRN